MSFMNILTSLAGQGGGMQASPEQHASVTQSLLSHFSNQPGGLSGLANQFRQNGMGEHVDGWLNSQPGQPPQALQPQQVEQGMGQDQIQSVAQHAGISPEIAKIALAAALPMLMSHLSQGSGQLPQQATSGSGLAGLAQSLFSRAL